MKSTLIKDTTKSVRIQLIKEWKEISEVNAAFNARYVSEIPDNDSSMSCGMGMRR